MDKIIKQAKVEAEVYAKCRVDGVMIENMHDVPYLHQKNLGPETTAAMTKICSVVREIVPSHIPCGLQVLAGGNCEAVAVAQASGCNFIRAEGFVFGHVADEGYMDACAGPLLRYRSNVKADNVSIYTDIKKKHSSHAITSDLNIAEVAKAAEYFLSDGVIVTGTATGIAADVQDLMSVKNSVKVPVLVGSGVTYENVENYLSANAIIIGSSFKFDGSWENAVDENRVGAFMDKMKTLRS